MNYYFISIILMGWCSLKGEARGAEKVEEGRGKGLDFVINNNVMNSWVHFAHIARGQMPLRNVTMKLRYLKT